MPSPSSLLSISGFLCEKLLQERDNVLSAIRIVEVFYVSQDTSISPELRSPRMFVYVAGKIAIGDEAEHLVDVYLERPNGDRKLLGETTKGVFKSGLPNFPGGFVIAMHVGVLPTHMGLHHIHVLFDGEQVLRIPFILSEPKQEAAQ